MFRVVAIFIRDDGTEREHEVGFYGDFATARMAAGIFMEWSGDVDKCLIFTPEDAKDELTVISPEKVEA